jgi:hypothetical protein
MNTVIGRPSNLVIVSDESLALVANSPNYQPEGSGFKSTPDNRIYVTHLKVAPPEFIAT